MVYIGAVITFYRSSQVIESFHSRISFGMNLSGGLHFQPVLDCWWCSVQNSALFTPDVEAKLLLCKEIESLGPLLGL